MATPAGVIATMIARRQFLQFAGVGVAAPFVPQVACAEAWPARRIKVIVPILAGTGVDILSRLVLNELATRLGQPIVIDNRPGATGTIGAAAVAKADADGYTILTDSSAHTIVPSLYLNLPYDPVRDFSPVIPLAAIMHDVTRFHECVERTNGGNPTGWIGVMRLAVQRVWG
jgi:tripartite-type tricarboxylate transporter receptor subunit TctC